MSIASNFSSVRPSLLLDFANVGRLDPRVTYSRASSATVYDGVTTAKAEENLLLRSQDYSATWTVTNLTPVTGKTAPDGTSTATEFTAGAANAVLTQGYTAIAGSYTFSVWLRRVTGTGDIEIAADNGTWTVKVITGTWARYDVTQTVAAGSKTAGVRVVTSGDAIEVWGAQLEQRSAVTAYTPTTTQPITNYVPVLQTAAAGVPRFQHNPVTGVAEGLLIEEQRSNLFTYSEDFADADWTKTRSSIDSNTIVAPDGTLTGDKLVEDTTASNTHHVNQSLTLSTGSVTYSIYAKAGERSVLQPFRTNLNIDIFTHTFNLTNGTASGTGASIVAVGNGWYRCIGTVNVNTAGSSGIAYSLNNGSTNSYTGDGYSGIFLWGAMLEEGAFSTSYIKTTSASATRNADAASMTGTNFSSWYSASEGTLYAESTLLGNSINRDVVAISDNTSSNSIQLRWASGSQAQFAVNVGGTNQVSIAPSGYSTLSQFYRRAGGYKINDFAQAIDGTSVGTDTSGTIPVVDRMYLGAGTSGTASLNGTIRKIAFYPTRLPDAQLVALTG